MGQSTPIRSKALIVEDDELQRTVLGILLEESEIETIQCASAEAAMSVLQERGNELAMMMTDVNLAGHMDGVELAFIAKRQFPNLHVIVTSGRILARRLPDGAKFWAKPWRPLDVLREAQTVVH